jgi:DNA oxidative demethylase
MVFSIAWFIDGGNIGAPSSSGAPPADWNSSFNRHFEAVMSDLFDLEEKQVLQEGAVLLRGRALPAEKALLAAIDSIAAQAPFRRMVTPGGFQMSVAMTNCGSAGWVTDRAGYRYDPRDPESGAPWPAMPDVFMKLAHDAAAEAGFAGFVPDACLINCYEPGARLSLHRDKDERDYSHAVVSVSLGLPATFQFGGLKRSDRPLKVPLQHGDIVVWGGPARLAYHGVLALKDGEHPTLGRRRFNLTFRKALQG